MVKVSAVVFFEKTAVLYFIAIVPISNTLQTESTLWIKLLLAA